MIEGMHLAGAGAYDDAGTSLQGLKNLNFIFGSNGSGKTTISRVIDNAASYPNCSVTWTAGKALETRVYNRDFVERHFDAESSIKGIYTFGENVDVAEIIKALKIEAAAIDDKLTGLNKVLHGVDGGSGKKKEYSDLHAQLIEYIWSAKKNLDDFDQAFSGLNNNKKNFCSRYLIEAQSNQAALRDVGDLRNDASTVFSSTLTEAASLPTQDGAAFSALEKAEILSKKIIGKDDVDIAALINALGNSDWVQQGRQYFDKLDDQCPFCQQKTDTALRMNLEQYFDASYVADLAAIDRLQEQYEVQTQALLDGYSVPSIADSGFLDHDEFGKDLAALRLAFGANIELIKGKRKEPSTPVALNSTAPLLAAVKARIDAANEKVKVNNDTLHNLDQRKKELSAQVWRRLLEDTKTLYGKYETDSGNLDKAIKGLAEQIEKCSEEWKAKQAEIEENERKITSIKPTIEAINKLLKSFGFVNFYLAESVKTGFYEIKRPGGEDAKATLSEGEKSFITFLYFYHLTRGSFSTSGATSDRIIVFDDPVSSLDSDILYIVCNLIKGIISEMRSGTSAVKQVFVLTHNIYFHKEITFNKKRSGADAMNDETFWVVRKSTSRSDLIASAENPIRSSYELLWREVRQEPPSDTAIQNVMRRILEHYFKFFGGVTPEHIIEKFNGQEKLICASLFSWINDGSHFANDDLYMSCEPGQVSRYLAVFQQIFELSDHGGHYKMMMGDRYVPIPAAPEAAEGQHAAANDAFAIPLPEAESATQ